MSCNHKDGFYTERVKIGRGVGYLSRCEDCGAKGDIKEGIDQAMKSLFEKVR